MSDDELVHVSHKVPEDHRDAARGNTKHGEMSELVRDLYQQKAEPNDVTDREEIDARLRDLRAERDKKRAELRRVTSELDDDIDELEVTIARLEERKETVQSRSDVFEGALSQLVTHVENGGSVWPEYPGVKSASELIDEPPEFVIEEIRERATGVSEEQFSEGVDGSEHTRGGLR